MTEFQPKPFVFVLMPFAGEFTDIYKLGIKVACENAGAYAERVDEQIFDGSMLDRIYNQISKADIVVADMTGKNPNVFYETGYAHALGKPVILVTQSADDIPFDLKHHFHIVYEKRISERLLPELEKRVRHFIANATNPGALQRKRLQIRVNGVDVVPDKREVLVNVTDTFVRFAICNATHRIIEPIEFQIGVLTPPDFRVMRGEFILSSFRNDDDSTLHMVDERFSLLPGVWESAAVRFVGSKTPIGVPFEMSLRIFTNSGIEDYSFVAKIVEPK